MAFSVVEYYARNNWVKHGLKRIMMNSKGFFFFKFDSRAGLKVILEGGPWLISKSPVILKKWLMDTRLLKEELTRISIWVKLHDVLIQVFEEDGISLIATFIGKPVMLDSYTSFICNDSWGRSSFARCLTERRGKVKSKSTNAGQFASPSVKQNVRYEPKATTSAQKNGATNVGNPSTSLSMLKTTDTSSKTDNIPSANSYFVLNDEEEEEEEDVENVYDETANLFTKIDGSSPFTAAVG
nr:zinc knuckle CX2CX4HX4C [Tanacetum cinerariifolium]